MSTFVLLLVYVLAWLVGVLHGIIIEAVRWRRNADQIQRIESGGRLFKVIHDKYWRPY